MEKVDVLPWVQSENHGGERMICEHGEVCRAWMRLTGRRAPLTPLCPQGCGYFSPMPPSPTRAAGDGSRVGRAQRSERPYPHGTGTWRRHGADGRTADSHGGRRRRRPRGGTEGPGRNAGQGTGDSLEDDGGERR